MQTAIDLLEWERETGKLLPMSVVEILDLEELGFVVNLETGEISKDPDYSVTASPN